jgi:uncharacterized membrane protein
MDGESQSRISPFSRERLSAALKLSISIDVKGGMDRKAKRALAIVLLLILVCILIAPWTIPEGSARGLDGLVGRIDNASEWEGMNPFAHVIYSIGDMYCHQMEARSFLMNGNQLPVCARDLGIVLGMALGMAAFVRLRMTMSPLHLILGLLPMALDGGLQLVTGYESINTIRLITGGAAGLVVAMFMAMVFQETLRRKEGETGRHRRS